MPGHFVTINDILTLYQHLLEMRTTIDGDGSLCPKLFDRLNDELTKVINLKEQQFEALRLKDLSRQIESLFQYLEQFRFFKETVNTFFNLFPSEQKDVFEDHSRYLQIQLTIRRLFTDFQEGNYLQSRIILSLDRLKSLIQTYSEHREQRKIEQQNLDCQIPLNSLPIFTPLQDTNYDGLSTYMGQFFPKNTAANYTSEQLTQIEHGYFSLKVEALKAELNKKNSLYAPLLPDLKQALKENDHPRIRIILQTMSELAPPIQITRPGNDGKNYFKVIQVQGTAPPDSPVSIVLNGTHQYNTHANPAGKFSFEHIELNPGQNTLICFNPRLRFMYPDVQRQIHLIEKLPFEGRIDPVTQQYLEPENIDTIVRCEKCRNYMYAYSVSENDNICVILKCNSKNFYKNSQPEFWTE
ncbi:MAG: hypothetical protein IPM47_02005 [Sphingobacteriales bacterium]|nr:MAG: hypothetical protein IPM47_02005 [Sphingobacteriales bacterium]